MELSFSDFFIKRRTEFLIMHAVVQAKMSWNWLNEACKSQTPHRQFAEKNKEILFSLFLITFLASWITNSNMTKLLLCVRAKYFHKNSFIFPCKHIISSCCECKMKEKWCQKKRMCEKVNWLFFSSLIWSLARSIDSLWSPFFANLHHKKLKTACDTNKAYPMMYQNIFAAFNNETFDHFPLRILLRLIVAA